MSRPPAYPKDAEKRLCIGCGEIKLAEEFYRKPNGYLRSKCISCWSSATRGYQRVHRRHLTEVARRYRASKPEVAKRARLKCVYGLTLEEFVEMYSMQDGRCLICGRAFAGQFDPLLHVDHDHATGRVRGLLCHVCNKGLGFFGESPERFRRAATYLEIW
jgi:5-methylcytosine-specific restriction endonuclease McrA